MRAESLLKIKENISLINNKISENHKRNIFWCPKYIDSAREQMGFTLYAYGGAVVSIYEKNENISIKLFNNTYDTYFLGTWDEMKEKLNAVKGKRQQDSRLEELKKWDDTIWNMIMDAFLVRAEKLAMAEEVKVVKGKNVKSYLERKRENVIAKNNRDMEQGCIRVVEMESKIPQAGKKPDLIGIRKDADTYIFSFIEYKCTTAGMNGVSLEEHFNDMSKYYKSEAVLEQMISYNYRLEVLEEREKVDISKKDVKSEIVFLFSHIGKEKGVSAQKVYNDLIKMERHEKFKEYKKDVKFIVLQDENQLLNAMNYYGYEEMVKYVKNNFNIKDMV